MSGVVSILLGSSCQLDSGRDDVKGGIDLDQLPPLITLRVLASAARAERFMDASQGCCCEPFAVFCDSIPFVYGAGRNLWSMRSFFLILWHPLEFRC